MIKSVGIERRSIIQNDNGREKEGDVVLVWRRSSGVEFDASCGGGDADADAGDADADANASGHSESSSSSSDPDDSDDPAESKPPRSGGVRTSAGISSESVSPGSWTRNLPISWNPSFL